MNRRDFLKRLGGTAAAITLSPLLDLAEILPAPEQLCAQTEEFILRCYFPMQMVNPRQLGIVTNIGE